MSDISSELDRLVGKWANPNEPTDIQLGQDTSQPCVSMNGTRHYTSDEQRRCHACSEFSRQMDRAALSDYQRGYLDGLEAGRNGTA